MNGLLKLHKSSPIVGCVPFKHLLYLALLSDISTYEDGDEKRWAIFAREQSDLYDYFSDWTSDDDKDDEVYNSLNELSEDGLIFFDDEDRIYVGEFRGRHFFPFEQKSSVFDKAVELLDTELKRYGKSKSAKDKSRARYIREQIDNLTRDVESMTPGSFTELHGYLYEIYTGGEVYTIRNKTEYYQTNNILKAYDRYSTFAILVEGVLHFDKYRKRGLPTLINVACAKDDIMRGLTQGDGSKDYMRTTEHSVSEDSDF